jgi:hypothetical protein
LGAQPDFPGLASFVEGGGGHGVGPDVLHAAADDLRLAGRARAAIRDVVLKQAYDIGLDGAVVPVDKDGAAAEGTVLSSADCRRGFQSTPRASRPAALVVTGQRHAEQEAVAKSHVRGRTSGLEL